MADGLDGLRSATSDGLDVVVVSFADDVDRLAAHRAALEVPFRFVADHERVLYGALDFGRGSWRRVWGWRAGRRYLQLLRAGARLQRSREDTLQLGGNVIVDDRGVPRWRFAGDGPDDRPSIDDLTRALSDLADT